MNGSIINTGQIICSLSASSSLHGELSSVFEANNVVDSSGNQLVDSNDNEIIAMPPFNSVVGSFVVLPSISATFTSV